MEQFKELVKKQTWEVLFLSGDKAPACFPPPSPLFTVKLHHKMLLSLAVTVYATVAVDLHSPRKFYPRQSSFNRETQTATCSSSESRRCPRERYQPFLAWRMSAPCPHSVGCKDINEVNRVGGIDSKAKWKAVWPLQERPDSIIQHLLSSQLPWWRERNRLFWDL